MTSALLADFPEERAADEAFFIEARDNDPVSEAKRQAAVLSHLKRRAPGVIVYHVPNGGKQSDWARLNGWKLGVVAGAPDLTIIWNHGILFAEMKDGTGMPSPQQRDMLSRLHRAGFRCGVYRRPETLLAHLRDAGVPFL
jgi:hypothetical protein